MGLECKLNVYHPHSWESQGATGSLLGRQLLQGVRKSVTIPMNEVCTIDAHRHNKGLQMLCLKCRQALHLSTCVSRRDHNQDSALGSVSNHVAVHIAVKSKLVWSSLLLCQCGQNFRFAQSWEHFWHKKWQVTFDLFNTWPRALRGTSFLLDKRLGLQKQFTDISRTCGSWIFWWNLMDSSKSKGLQDSCRLQRRVE